MFRARIVPERAQKYSAPSFCRGVETCTIKIEGTIVQVRHHLIELFEGRDLHNWILEELVNVTGKRRSDCDLLHVILGRVCHYVEIIISTPRDPADPRLPLSDSVPNSQVGLNVALQSRRTINDGIFSRVRCSSPHRFLVADSYIGITVFLANSRSDH